MLLRSVTKHVKEQNWFAVFIDLAIVVVGVFIGIQVSNWNQTLAGEHQAKVLLNRLSADVKNDQDALKSELDYQVVVRKYAINAINALNGDSSVNDEQFVIGAYQASQINGAWTNRATYNEMLSTGQINLIKSDHLKGLIFGYYSTDFNDLPQIKDFAPYREFIRGLIPITIQDAIRENCGDIVIEVAKTFSNKLPESCDLDIPNGEMGDAAKLLRMQPDMLAKLQYQVAVYDTQVFTISNFVDESQKLMNALKTFQKQL
ncbi:DUF6090 family protein [Paraglaciecola sp.]|uniref:DUF6090 family protein n=1 Tax=Paraglaciecola sp. TaxID=1920173 RepID=UPI003EF3C568